ncbi:CaiB/BaiF CoA transferase family protein [Sabulicella glaciei]|uniref:CoA transferase n=1 Tax=Sabulicella glaciei TaxID=2984948 RepID=A0ABT3NXH0_9PROT|nr:CaiB/BaiF CoA-transferase family protein [Roseococcus sp. MDT2-1-1]MCW8086868.1 CoA transferase [Roseococcus sp. MDT2-1-1]
MSLPVVHPDPSRTGPLSGVRVVDLSRLVAGNMLTLQLADFGAEVIKVEPAGAGDTLRAWRERHPDHPGGFDGWWQAYGRNKRSLALDLRDPEAGRWLRRLVLSAQVLVESFRPGTLEAMGLAPEALHAENPGLVVVRISGWGQTGPYRELPGFGSLVEGFSGFAQRHARPDGTPELPNMALADMVTGLSGAFAVAAALREVEVRGGRGQVVDLSLLEPMASIMGPDVTNRAALGDAPRIAKIASPRGVYRCADGLWVSLSGSTEAMARRIFAAIGEAALTEDPRFADNAARLAHDAEVDAILGRFIGGMTQEACLALFRAEGVTVGPILGPAELLADPHVAGRGVYVRAQDGAREVVMHAPTPRLSGTPGTVRRLAPRLGEDTAAILGELGAEPEEVAALSAPPARR